MEVNRYHLDPDKGMYHTRLGKDAGGMADAADEWMDNLASEYSMKLNSPSARANFMRQAGQVRMRQSNNNMQWEFKQYDAYRDAEADAAVSLALDEIGRNYLDDGLVEEKRGNIYQALELKLRGLGDEARRAAVLEMEERIGLARINPLIQDRPMEAEAWLRERREDFSAETFKKLEKHIESASEPYKIEAIRDEIMARFSDEGAALKFIIDNFEGDFEKKVYSAVEGMFVDRRRIQSQREADAYDRMQNLISGADNLAGALAAIERSGLSARHKAALAREARSRFGAGEAWKTGEDWIDAREEAMAFQAGSGSMSLEERAVAARVFNAKWADKIAPSNLRTLNNMFFSRPGGSGGTGNDPYNRFNPLTRITQMAREAGIFNDYNEEILFWDEFSRVVNGEEAQLGRQLSQGELMEIGEKFTGDVVVERRNNLAERIITGLTGGRITFKKDKEVTVKGYQAAGMGFYESDVFYDEETGGYYVMEDNRERDEIDEMMDELEYERLAAR